MLNQHFCFDQSAFCIYRKILQRITRCIIVDKALYYSGQSINAIISDVKLYLSHREAIAATVFELFFTSSLLFLMLLVFARFDQTLLSISQQSAIKGTEVQSKRTLRISFDTAALWLSEKMEKSFLKSRFISDVVSFPDIQPLRHSIIVRNEISNYFGLSQRLHTKKLNVQFSRNLLARIGVDRFMINLFFHTSSTFCICRESLQ